MWSVWHLLHEFSSSRHSSYYAELRILGFDHPTAAHSTSPGESISLSCAMEVTRSAMGINVMVSIPV